MAQRKTNKAKFIVRKSKKTGKTVKLYGAPMMKVLEKERTRKRKNSAKRRRNAQTSSRPLKALLRSSPAGQFARTLGLTNPVDSYYPVFEIRKHPGKPQTLVRVGNILASSKSDAVKKMPHIFGNEWRKTFKLGVPFKQNPRRANLDHRDAAHPIEVRHYWQGRKGYLTPWQRAHQAGQQQLFRMNNPAKRKNSVLLGINGRKGRGSARRRNGEEGLFEEFHGRPSDGFKMGLAPTGTPKTTEFLGKLELLEYRNGSKSELTFGHGDHDEPDLVSNQSGTHLYIVGDIPCWSDKPNIHVGYLTKIEYRAIKNHIDGGRKTLYFHKVGEETGVLPSLCTDAEGYLIIKGGEYHITADGIIN